MGGSLRYISNMSMFMKFMKTMRQYQSLGYTLVSKNLVSVTEYKLFRS